MPSYFSLSVRAKANVAPCNTHATPARAHVAIKFIIARTCCNFSCSAHKVSLRFAAADLELCAREEKYRGREREGQLYQESAHSYRVFIWHTFDASLI